MPEPPRQLSRRELRAATAIQPVVSPPALTGGIRRVTPDGELSDVQVPGAAAPDRGEVLSAESRAAALRAQAARAQAEREEAARLNLERSQAQRLATQRADAERAERERLEREAAERVLRAQAEAAQRASIEEQQALTARLERERIEQRRIDVERGERERAEAARVEHERAERLQDETTRQEVERTARRLAAITQGQRPRDVAPPEGPTLEPDAPAPTRTSVWPGPASGPAARPTTPPVPFTASDAPAAPPEGPTATSGSVPGTPARVGRLHRDVPDVEAAPVPQWGPIVPPGTSWGPRTSAERAPSAGWPVVAQQVERALAPGATDPALAEVGAPRADRAPAAVPAPLDEVEVDAEEAPVATPTHLFTWLHMIVLIVVAFVLGMLIFMVVTQDTGAAGAQGAGDLAVVVALPSDPTGN